MAYPEILVEINYFMFGVITGTLFTTALFAIADYANKKQRSRETEKQNT